MIVLLFPRNCCRMADPFVATSWIEQGESSGFVNSTDECVPWSVTFSATVSVFVSLCFLMGLTSNGGIVFTLLRPRNRYLINPTNILLGNIGLVSLLYFLIAVPMSVWSIANRGEWPGNTACQINGFATSVCACAIWQGHGIIAAERLAKIIAPYKKVFTMRVPVGTVIATWCLTISVGVLPYITESGYIITKSRVMCSINFGSHGSPTPVVVSAIMLLSLGTMLLCQAGVYRVARRIRREHHSSSCAGTISPIGTSSFLEKERIALRRAEIRRLKEEIHLAVASFQSSILFILVFVIPAAVEVVANLSLPTEDAECNLERIPRIWVSTVHYLLVVADIALNPFLYILRNVPMKNAMVDILKKRRSIGLNRL